MYGNLIEVEIVDDREEITVFFEAGVEDVSLELVMENEINIEINAKDREDQEPVPTNFLENDGANIKDPVIIRSWVRSVIWKPCTRCRR